MEPTRRRRVSLPAEDQAESFGEAAPPKSKFAPPPIDRDLGGIIETFFKIDFENDWKLVHDALVVGTNDRSNHKQMEAHLDHAEDVARIAHRLWCNADVKRKNFKLDSDATLAAMRVEANDALQAEKDGGHRSKAITDADIQAKMMELHPDEFRSNQLDQHKTELLVEHCADLARQATSKCRSLNTMLAKMRGGGVVD